MSEGLEIGSEIAGYRLNRELGRGTSGPVFAAEQISDEYEVALRIAEPKLAADEAFRERFLKEAEASRAVDHPNICRILNSGEEDGVLWAAMDLVDGTDLASILAAEGPQKPLRAVTLLQQVAEALDAVHAAGLAHRDLKASNILIEGADIGEWAMVSDFGIAVPHSASNEPASSASSHYTAPERLLGDSEGDHRGDIYALGCLLFECLVGRPPFDLERPEEVLKAHREQEPPRPSELVTTLPAAIDEGIATALHKDPGSRFQTCQELIDAAEAALTPVLTPTPGPPRVPAGEPEPGGLVLEAIRGEAAGATITVARDLLIGREAVGAGQLAADQEISRRHARIWCEPAQGWMIEDLGSTNGSFVNGEPVTEPRALTEQDRIDVGATTLRVVSLAVPEPESVESSSEHASQPTPPASRVISAAMVEAIEAEEMAQPPTAPQDTESPEPAPPLEVGLKVDLEGREARIALGDGGEEVRVVYEDGAWRLDRE